MYNAIVFYPAETLADLKPSREEQVKDSLDLASLDAGHPATLAKTKETEAK